MRTESIGDLVPAVSVAFPGFSFAGRIYPIIGPARLGGKGAAAPLLTGQAMAHRNPHRLAHTSRAELSAATGGNALNRFLFGHAIPTLAKVTTQRADTPGDPAILASGRRH